SYLSRTLTFFFDDTATAELHTLSLHDALPILDLQTIQRLTPFVHIGGKSSLAGVTWKNLKEENEQTIMLRLSRVLQKARGYGITDRKSTRLNSSHVKISYAVFCLKKKKDKQHK